VTPTSDRPGVDAAAAPVGYQDFLDCLRRFLGESFPQSGFATEGDPIILAVAAMGPIGAVLEWSLGQVEAYHPYTPSLISMGLMQDYLPVLRAAYAALISGIGATDPGAPQQAGGDSAAAGRRLRAALSRCRDVIDEINALLDAKNGFPVFASAMTIRELEIVAGGLVEARSGTVTALGWSRCNPRV